jgi:hypothetical protein
MTRDEAHALQKQYWRHYGTTLNGLMVNNQVSDHGRVSSISCTTWITR